MSDNLPRQRRQWGAAPDLSLRALADSQSMELPVDSSQQSISRRAMRRSGGSVQSSGDLGSGSFDISRSADGGALGSRVWEGGSTVGESIQAQSTAGRPVSRPSAHNITKQDLQVLRDSMMELDLHMTSDSVGSYHGPDTIQEDSDEDSDFVYSDVDEDFESYDGSDSEPSPMYSSAGEVKVMSAAPPTRVSRELKPARPGSGRPTSAASVRPLTGAPVQPKEAPKGRDEEGDMAGVLAALSKENKAVMRSSMSKEKPKAADAGPSQLVSGSKGSQGAAAAGGLPPAKKDKSPTKMPPRSKGRGGQQVDVPRFSAKDWLTDSLDTPGATIKRISGRLARLDPNKQRILQQVLEKLEKAEAAGSINVSAMFSSLATGAPKAKSSLSAASHPPLPATDRQPPPPAACKQELVLRMLSSHDGGAEAGLTEVELFDAAGGRIELLPEDVALRGGSGSPESGSSLGRIVSGRSRTVNERHMWLGQLGSGAAGARPLEVVIRTPVESRVATRMLVWNFNKSMHDLGRGTKEMQVYVDGDLTWQGIVSRGCGNQTFDYSTVINLVDVPEVTKASASEGAAAAPAVTEEAASKESRSVSISRKGSGKGLDELSNEELLEELKRRSLPLENNSTPERQKEEKRGILPTAPPPKLSESERNASNAAPSPSKTTAANTDDSPAKPGNRSKLEGLRSRLSARRGSKSEAAGTASAPIATTSAAAATAGGAPAAEPGGGPIWLPGSSKQQAGADGVKAGGSGRAVSNLLARRRGSDTGEAQLKEAAIGSPVPAPQAAKSHSSPGRSRMVSPPQHGAAASAASAEKESTEIYGLLGTRSRPVSGRRAAKPDAPAKAEERKPKPAPREQRGSRVSELDSSLDSLEFFQKNQAGRLDKSISLAKSRLGVSAAAGAPKDKPPVAESVDDMEALIQAELADMDEDDALIKDELENWLMSSSSTAAPARTQEAAETSQTEAAPQFVIPQAPSGKLLEVVIHSTWGDSHYVGLCGIELFNTRGELVSISNPSTQVSAQPASINELAEYSADPRTPDKLVDGVNMTCDDLHVWLAPYAKGTLNRISVSLDTAQELGMLRVWNYNKNRIHSQRGARHVEIGLDGNLIFYGEIRRAPGSLAEAPAFAECILFSEGEGMLQAVEAYDAKYHRQRLEAERVGTPPSASDSMQPSPLEVVTNDADDPLGFVAGKVGSDGRPMTSAIQQPPPAAASSSSRLGVITEDSPPSSRGAGGAPSGGMPGLMGRELRLVVLATWGDPYYMGLTGLQVLGAGGNPLPLTASSLDACPRDLNAIPGYSGDDRTLDKLLDGVNMTSNDAHMWLAPMKVSTLSGGPVSADDPNGYLTIRLGPGEVEVTGLRVWNYNKSLEDTTRGLKAVQLLLDGKPISPPGGHILSKAPGDARFDFGQTLRLHPSLATTAPSALATGSGMLHAGLEASAWIHAMPDPIRAQEVWLAARKARNHCALLRQDFDTPLLPCGFVMKLILLNSWGDLHYVGLTGIELVDAVQGPVKVRPERVTAAPRSVADLPGMERDVRVPARLVDRPNNSAAPSNSWLAPLVKADVGGDKPWEPNTLTIALDTPVMLSAIRLWNYAKTPARGVQEIEILLDDLMIFKGYVRCAPTGSQGAWQHSIIFHNSPEFMQSEATAAYSHLATMEREGPIMLVNDRKLVPGSAKASLYSEPGDRPTTSVVAH